MDEEVDVVCAEEAVEVVYLFPAMAESSHRQDKGSSYIVYCRGRVGILVNDVRVGRWVE